MGYTNEEIEEARRQYQIFIEDMLESEEFRNEWTGHWDDFKVHNFGQKEKWVKGDKDKYLKYWKDNQELIQESYGNF